VLEAGPLVALPVMQHVPRHYTALSEGSTNSHYNERPMRDFDSLIFASLQQNPVRLPGPPSQYSSHFCLWGRGYEDCRLILATRS